MTEKTEKFFAKWGIEDYIRHNNADMCLVTIDDIDRFMAGDDSLIHWKYVKREPDGKGGWIYWYPGDLVNKAKKAAEDVKSSAKKAAEDVKSSAKKAASGISTSISKAKEAKSATPKAIQPVVSSVSAPSVQTPNARYTPASTSPGLRDMTDEERRIEKETSDYVTQYRDNHEQTVIAENTRAALKLLGGTGLTLGGIGAAALGIFSADKGAGGFVAGMALISTGFTVGGAGISKIIDTLSEMASKSDYIEKMKKYYKKRDSEPIDPSTGFHVDPNAKDPADRTVEDLAKDAAITNAYGMSLLAEDTQNNCMLCTMTYEMRVRGYDVIANTASIGYVASDIEQWFEGANVQVYEGRYERFFEELAKQGVGARGYVGVSWTVGGGHAMSYEVREDGVYIIDGQDGSVYPPNSSQLTWLFDYTTGGYTTCRLDNLEPKKNNIRKIMQ